MVKVGMVLHVDSQWLGGLNYFRNLLSAIRSLPDSSVEPVIFTGTKSNESFANFPPFQMVRSSLVHSGSPSWFLRKVVSYTSARDHMLEALLLKYDASVLSHSGYLGAGSPIASIGWIPDFQFVRLPALYSRQERSRRSRIYREMCERCDMVILSSESAKGDFRAFAPKYVDKVRVLKFVASPGPNEGVPSLPELRQRYQFEGPYFLLPNQFWAHKNHRIVITALKLLRQQQKRLLVLATGSSVDDRNSGFYRSLMQYAEGCKVSDRFRVLGIIPFSDLAGLMKHAVALINPSTFEGWSTSVEESKSAGKQVLLSDLPVHREQSPEFGQYFPADDAEVLAKKLWATLQDFDVDADLARQNRARKAFPDRQREFARQYESIVLSASHLISRGVKTGRSLDNSSVGSKVASEI